MRVMKCHSVTRFSPGLRNLEFLERFADVGSGGLAGASVVVGK